jgi:RNA polymerase sigma-70 factor (ECF subfamily)
MADETATGARLDVELLYATHAPAIYRFFLQRIGNIQDAEDLTAATFSRVLASCGRYQERGRLTAWLFSIARHTLQNEQRGRANRINLVAAGTALADPDPLPEIRMLQIEQACQLHKLLDQLPADQQEALLLRFFGELALGEIAAHMGRSVGSVKMLLHRAIARLRERYRQTEQIVARIMAAVCAPAPPWYAYQPLVCRAYRMDRTEQSARVCRGR